jgi:multicomponent Na+:H+ antiporter subunit D
VYALIRMFTLILPLNQTLLQGVFLWVAALTMITGVLGAVAQNEVRRLLSFHIISQIGYMLMGLALFTPLALAGAVFFILHNIVVKTNLFLIGGVMERMGGTGDLKRLGGLYQTAPGLSVLFLISAMSLAGIPPLSGFFAKLSLIQAGLATEQFALVGAALAVSLLTLYSMTKIWTMAFWKPMETSNGERATLNSPTQIPSWGLWLTPIVVLAAATILVGFGAGLTFPMAMRAGSELMDPSIYITAVFGSGE